MEQKWHDYRNRIIAFLWGLLWTCVGGLAPATLLVFDWLNNYSDPIDWAMVTRMAVAGASGGALGYWRKHKALLQLPPGVIPQVTEEGGDAAQ